jgi:hypothetical protein
LEKPFAILRLTKPRRVSLLSATRALFSADYPVSPLPLGRGGLTLIRPSLIMSKNTRVLPSGLQRTFGRVRNPTALKVKGSLTQRKKSVKRNHVFFAKKVKILHFFVSFEKRSPPSKDNAAAQSALRAGLCRGSLRRRPGIACGNALACFPQTPLVRFADGWIHAPSMARHNPPSVPDCAPGVCAPPSVAGGCIRRGWGPGRSAGAPAQPCAAWLCPAKGGWPESPQGV